MIEIDGSRLSGSGTIVRQAVLFAALTGQAIHIVKARRRRLKPGLRLQHIRVIEALRELVGGRAEGLTPGSQEVTFRPGRFQPQAGYRWDIGSAGSTTMLALALLPMLACSPHPIRAELRGGLFQDFAPSVFHLQHVILHLLRRMGLQAEVTIVRPGYVPSGEGILHLTVTPGARPWQSLRLEEPGGVARVWGIALSSHLRERRVSQRMAESASQVLAAAGHRAEIEIREDEHALQPGAALALFADQAPGGRLGADQAGALGRPAEAIGVQVARHLLDDLDTGATLDHWAADQVIPFAALAEGESRFRLPRVTEHVLTNAWLAEELLGAKVRVEAPILSVSGVGFRIGQA